MTKYKIFIVFLVIISIIGGIYISREMNKPRMNEWYLNVITGEVVIIDSIKNKNIFVHSEVLQKNKVENEKTFLIHYKKIK